MNKNNNILLLIREIKTTEMISNDLKYVFKKKK